MEDDELYSERKPPWWRITRQNVWHKLNVLAATAIGVYVIGFRFGDVYDWVTLPDALLYIGIVLAWAIAGSVTFVNWAGAKWGPIVGAWAVLGAVFMVFVVGRAAGDSTTLRHSNCWRLSGNDSDEIVPALRAQNCAPEAPTIGSAIRAVLAFATT